MERRGFLGRLIAAPIALLVAKKVVAAPLPVKMYYPENSPLLLVHENYQLAKLLGMRTKRVNNIKHHFTIKLTFMDGEITDYNFLQVFRTRASTAGDKERALLEHRANILFAIEHGCRYQMPDRDITAMGGRSFFGMKGKGVATYLKGRALVWQEDPFSDAGAGEWLSDVGFIPSRLEA